MTNSIKKTAIICATALLAAMYPGTREAKANVPEWLHSAVMYQIYPSSFQDTDGDGIGDLRGIIERLDYVKSLGVNTIWLNPIFCSEWQDGGYDVTDYYKVDPRFGTNSDLVKLVKECHARGIRICLDLVAGHTSNKHPWFVESSEGEDLHHSDWFIWTNENPDKEGESNIATGTTRKFSKYVEADAPRGKYYVRNASEFQPALNYGYAVVEHPWEQPVTAEGPQAVRREMYEIMRFWFEKGVDGFRVDMAASLVKNDPGHKETIKFWDEVDDWIRQNYPDNILLAEWGDPEQAIKDAKFSIDFMFHFGVPGYPSLFFDPATPYGQYATFRSSYEKTGAEAYKDDYFDIAGKGGINEFVQNYTKEYSLTKGHGYIALPTCNHDYQRPNIDTRNTIDQLKVAMTFFMTMPGVPLLYYGDEIGMKYLDLPDKEGSGNRAGCRTPMQWTAGRNAGFSTCQESDLYLPEDTEGGKLTVEKQENDPESLLSYTKMLLSLRTTSPALGNDGEWEQVSDVKHPYPWVYKRYSGNDVYYVVLNPSAKAVKAEIPAQGFKGMQMVVGEKSQGSYKCGKKSDSIKAAGVSALIFKAITNN